MNDADTDDHDQADQPETRPLNLYEIESALDDIVQANLDVDAQHEVLDSLLLHSLEREEAEAELYQLEAKAQQLNKTRDEYFGRAKSKRDAMGRYISGLEHQEKQMAAEIKRLQARKKRAVRAKAFVREWIAYTLVEKGVKKLEGDLYTLTVRKAPDSVEFYDEDKVPEEFCKQPPSVPSKTLCMDAIKLRYAKLVAEWRKQSKVSAKAKPPNNLKYSVEGIPGAVYIHDKHIGGVK